MKQLGLTLMTLILMNCSQSSDDLDLSIIFSEVGGLTVDNQVTLNGYEIGKIKSITVGQAYEIIVNVSINKSVTVPNDSKFILVREIMGNTFIKVIPGSSPDKLSDGQQINGQFENQNKLEGGLFNLIEKVLGNPTKQDSILIELRQLNRNIDRLLNKK